MTKRAKPTSSEEIRTYFTKTLFVNEVEAAWARTVLTGVTSGDLYEEVARLSPHLTKLRKETNNFKELSLKITVDGGALTLQDNEGLGNPGHAALFFAAFLARWRPELAIRLTWRAMNLTRGRSAAGTILIGPEGINALQGHRHRMTE